MIADKTLSLLFPFAPGTVRVDDIAGARPYADAAAQASLAGRLLTDIKSALSTHATTLDVTVELPGLGCIDLVIDARDDAIDVYAHCHTPHGQRWLDRQQLALETRIARWIGLPVRLSVFAR